VNPNGLAQVLQTQALSFGVKPKTLAEMMTVIAATQQLANKKWQIQDEEHGEQQVVKKKHDGKPLYIKHR
jgi:hypothetical protein